MYELILTMQSLSCFLLILMLINQTICVKLNVEGSVSLGKDVIETLSQFLGNAFLSGRRSLVPVEENPIVLIVRRGVLCRNLDFCQQVSNFVDEFVTVLAMSIKTVINTTLNNFNEIVFEQQLKHYLDISRTIIENTNSKITEDNQVYYWIDTIKKVCARFQEMASIFVMDELQSYQTNVTKIKQELNRKLVIATVLVERKYQTKLCEEHKLCVKSYEVTQSLNTLLEHFKTMKEDKVRLFIKYFYEAISDCDFYMYVSESIAHELQVVLNDMAYSTEVPTKEILLTVHKIIENRIEAIKTNEDQKMSHDALLMHMILSDLDHIYSVHKSDPFKEFFQHFYKWLLVEIRIDKTIRNTVKNISAELKTVSDDLFAKLIIEVKLFLDITVEPENKDS